MKPVSTALLALYTALIVSYSTCFTLQPRIERFVTSLEASKSKKRSKKSPSSGAGGGGFGGDAKPPSSSSDSTKVRSVSGFTGSGTKPLRIAANTFDRLRKESDNAADCTHDVYVRSPANNATLYWFVGKIARCLDESDLVGTSVPTPQEAVLSQKRLILEYAKNQLRPQNFGGPYASSLELWLAPGDSEMDVVQNKVVLELVEGSTRDISDTFRVSDVGFNPEIYVGDEVQKGGLRVVRDEQGRPVKPVFEVNESA